MIAKVANFIKYWYLRYILVTELYMVEAWEKITIHILFGLLFYGFWIFNYSILLKVVDLYAGYILTGILSIAYLCLLENHSK